MSNLVTIEIEDHVASVRLNRPDKYNSLSLPMFDAIIDAGERLSRDRSVRAVVLSGEGRGFCAGLDIENFGVLGSVDNPDDIGVFARKPGYPANQAQNVAYVWKQVPVPVIAAIHGVAYGGGLQIALAADIRLATPDAKLSVMEVKWGLIPDMSGSQTLRDLVRIDIAKELTFTGRTVTGEEAEKIGLVTRVCNDPLTEALELARTIADKSPDAVSSAKKLLEAAWHGDSEMGLKLEEQLQKKLIGSPNQLEAVLSNFEKRPARYQDRNDS